MNTTEKLYYFAHPYSAGKKKEEIRNFELCSIRSAKLINAGYKIYSPICHTHPIEVAIGGKPWEFWLELDKLFVDRCDGLILAPNWEYSKGCQREIRWFQEQNKEILEYEGIIK